MSKNQLDMLLEDSDGKRVYIKYHLGKNIRQNHIDEIIDDLFNIEKTLEKDSVIIIIKDIPNDTINGLIKSIWENEEHIYYYSWNQNSTSLIFLNMTMFLGIKFWIKIKLKNLN